MKTKFTSLLLSLCLLTTLALGQSGADLPSFGKGILATATTPVNGTNEVQTLTIGGTPSGGTFKISFRGKSTGAITWSSTNNTLVNNVAAALEALGEIGTSNVSVGVGTMTAGVGTITIQFVVNLSKLDVPLMVATSSLTGSSPTAAITTTTPGVTADGRNSPKGQLLIDKGNGKLYINTSSTSQNPTWTVVGSQS